MMLWADFWAILCFVAIFVLHRVAFPDRLLYICNGFRLSLIIKSFFMKEQVLKAMREAGKPVSAGDVTKALGADRKEVDKAFAELKKEGAIVSPVRCKWEPAN